MESNCNGRVNILGNNTMDQFQLYDKIPISGKDNFSDNALTGNWESNNLSNAFFNEKNINILHNAIRAGVHKKSNGRFLIGQQDIDILKIIMRSIYLQHSKNLNTNITEQIIELNKIVTDYAIPQIIGEATGYIKYKSDSSMMHTPIDRPISTFRNNTLELKPWF